MTSAGARAPKANGSPVLRVDGLKGDEVMKKVRGDSAKSQRRDPAFGVWGTSGVAPIGYSDFSSSKEFEQPMK